MPGFSYPPAIKRLGQNFLIDPNIVRKIVALADLTPQDTVFEIGPGRGVLTEALSGVARRVVAVEIDPVLHSLLFARQDEWPNVDLICEDALEYPIEQLPPATVVVANLPYYLSTPLLFKLLDCRDRFLRMVLMLQNEVADRLVAKPGGSEYGVLSVMAQYAADITKAFKVSANCFRPRPDVASAVVLLTTRTSGRLAPEEEARVRSLVKASFAHRRKTLVNSLRDAGYDIAPVVAALEQLKLSPACRAETLSVKQFVDLTHRCG